MAMVCRGRLRLAGDGQKALPELVPAVGQQLEPGRPGMTTEPDEEVGTALEGRPQVERAVAPARGADDVAELRPDDGGSATVLDQSGGDQTDDPDAPRTAHDGGRGR